jgi:hypothetical protein
MYDSQYFFVANPINRYSISPRQNLKANSDGSIDNLCVQRHTPGADKEGNWLPHLQARQESRAELAGRTPAEQLALGAVAQEGQ